MDTRKSFIRYRFLLNSPFDKFESMPKEQASIQSSFIDIKWPYFQLLTTYIEQVSSQPQLNVGKNKNNYAYPYNKEKNPILSQFTH